MIDSHFIESAKIIRKKFIKTNSNLDNYHNEIQNLLKFLTEKIEIFKKIEEKEFKNKPTKEEIERISKMVLVEISSIESKQVEISKNIDSLNQEILKLQEEEEFLYKKIKERYPKYSDEEIKEQIQSNLEY
jgi:hypothetical protein